MNPPGTLWCEKGIINFVLAAACFRTSFVGANAYRLLVSIRLSPSAVIVLASCDFAYPVRIGSQNFSGECGQVAPKPTHSLVTLPRKRADLAINPGCPDRIATAHQNLWQVQLQRVQLCHGLARIFDCAAAACMQHTPHKPAQEQADLLDTLLKCTPLRLDRTLCAERERERERERVRLARFCVCRFVCFACRDCVCVCVYSATPSLARLACSLARSLACSLACRLLACLPACLPACLFLCFFVSLFVCLFVCLFVSLFVCTA